MPKMLSKAELKFIEDLRAEKVDGYAPTYRRTLKHRILKKRKKLTDELLLVNAVLDKLESL